MVPEALERIHRAYRRAVPEAAVDRALSAWIRAGRLDFGRLDEAMQRQVIQHLHDAPQERSALEPPSLDTGLADPATVVANRDRIRRHFGLHTYGERLLRCYGAVLESEPAPPAALDGGALLDHYLSPERLYLLRT
jgi:hypothetical protein